MPCPSRLSLACITCRDALGCTCTVAEEAGSCCFSALGPPATGPPACISFTKVRTAAISTCIAAQYTLGLASVLCQPLLGLSQLRAVQAADWW